MEDSRYITIIIWQYICFCSVSSLLWLMRSSFSMRKANSLLWISTDHDGVLKNTWNVILVFCERKMLMYIHVVFLFDLCPWHNMTTNNYKLKISMPYMGCWPKNVFKQNQIHSLRWPFRGIDHPLRFRKKKKC